MKAVALILAELPSTFCSRTAAEAGLTPRVMERLVRNLDVVRVQPGLFRQPEHDAAAGPEWELVRRDHLVRAAAALLVHPHHALSHVTNALARGWPVDLRPDSLVHLTAITVQPRSRRVADRFLHHSDSITNAVELVEGMRALTADRTVADCLRLNPARQE